MVYISENFDKGGANKAGFRYLAEFLNIIDVINLDSVQSVSSVRLKFLFLQKIFEKIVSRIFQLDENIDFNFLGKIKYLDIIKYDVIIINNMGHGFLSWPTIFRLKNKRIIFINHDYYFFNGILHYPSNKLLKYLFFLNNILFKLSFNRFSKNNHCIFIFPSKYLLNKFNNLNFKHVDVHYVKIPFNKIDFNRNLRFDKLKILVIADSLKNHRKGFDRIKNFIVKNNSKYEFNLVGSGLSNDIFENVIFHGYISNQVELNSLYSNCNVLLIPSREDNAPLVALEAIENGCYVISSTSNGLIEYFSVNSGFVCDFDNHDTIIDSLNSIFKSNFCYDFISEEDDFMTFKNLLIT